MLGRRAVLLGFAAASCSRRERIGEGGISSGPPVSASPLDRSASGTTLALPSMPDASDVLPRGEVGTETWSFEGGGRAVVIVPSWTPRADKLPVLVTLHGRGEAVKGPLEGVMGWPRDYALLRAIRRVTNPPLTREDFEGFVEPKRLAEANTELLERPFRGLVVVCPYLPDLDLGKTAQVRAYADHLVRSVLPRVRAELPASTLPLATGIDGVSLGGAVALRTGLWNAGEFGAVGSLQAAIRGDQIGELTELARAARAMNRDIKLRLLTSKEDYFRDVILRTSAAWRSGGVDHDVVDVPGPHDYPFNRGPGAIEMLLWHDRVLARA